MGAARGPGGDIVASATGARTVRSAASTRRVETGVSALPPLLLPLIIRTALVDGPLGVKRRLLWGLEILRSHLVSRLIPTTGLRRGAARPGRRSDYQESRSGNPYRSFLVPFRRGRHRGLGIPLDEARPLDRTDLRGGPRPGAGGLGARREHRERRPRLRLLGPRGPAVQRERGRGRRVDRGPLLPGDLDRHPRARQRTRPLCAAGEPAAGAHVAGPPGRRRTRVGRGARPLLNRAHGQQRPRGLADPPGPRRHRGRPDDVAPVLPDHRRPYPRGAEERVPRLSGRVVWHREDRPPLRPLARGRRGPVRGLHAPAPRRHAREPLPRPAGLAAPERTWGPRPPPRARLALRGQLALRPRLFPAEPRRPGPPADLHRVRPDLLFLHRAAARGGPQLHPRVGVQVPLRARIDPRPPAGFADGEHASPPHGDPRPDGRPRRRARAGRHDDPRGDAIRRALPGLAAVPPRHAPQGRHPDLQGPVQRGPPAPGLDRPRRHVGYLDRRLLPRRPAAPREPGLVAPGLGPRGRPGPRSRVVALPTESSERTRTPTRVDGEPRASRLGRPILLIRETCDRRAATVEQHDEEHGEDPRDGAGELLRSDWIRGAGDVERDGGRYVGTERRVVIVDETRGNRV